MSRARKRGAALAVGLMLLTVITLLALAAAGSAHVEQVLAQNDGFRENAASAASSGIEMAIRAIVTSSDPAAVPAHLAALCPAPKTVSTCRCGSPASITRFRRNQEARSRA